MSTSKKSTKTRAKSATSEETSPKAEIARSVYADYEIWASRKKPKWHPVKKMRYVFFRMIEGCTITDALREIHWSPSEFWHLVDHKENAHFHDEYKRAKILQGRAIADQVMVVSEGRDRVTKKSLAKMRKIIERGLKRASQQKSKLAMKAIIESVLAQISENDTRVLGRNKLQIDAAKWLAKAVNPLEYSEKTNMTLSQPNPDGHGDPVPLAIQVQFIAPDGSVVEPL